MIRFLSLAIVATLSLFAFSCESDITNTDIPELETEVAVEMAQDLEDKETPTVDLSDAVYFIYDKDEAWGYYRLDGRFIEAGDGWGFEGAFHGVAASRDWGTASMLLDASKGLGPSIYTKDASKGLGPSIYRKDASKGLGPSIYNPDSAKGLGPSIYNSDSSFAPEAWLFDGRLEKNDRGYDFEGTLEQEFTDSSKAVYLIRMK